VSNRKQQWRCKIKEGKNYKWDGANFTYRKNDLKAEMTRRGRKRQGKGLRQNANDRFEKKE